MKAERIFVSLMILGVWAVAPLKAQLTWSHLSPGGSLPPARQSAGVVFVQAPGDTYGAMYIFGGYGNGTRYNDMYKLSLRPGQEVWTQITQQNPWPSGRTGFVMAYDSAGNRIIGYGGDEGNYTARGDCWAFDLGTLRWHQIDTLIGYHAPAPRVGGDAAFFSGTQKLYLFGGTSWRYPDGWFWDDTWRLDPVTGTWQQLSPIGNYIPRGNGVAIIDEVDNRMVTFGGIMGSGTWVNETWTIGPLEQPNMTIAPLYPGGSYPPAMRHSVAVYDSSGPRMILFSGQDDGGSLHNEVWELRLSLGSEQWNALSVGGTPPPQMYVATAVLDEPNQRMIVFGGNTGGGQINDVYALGPILYGIETPPSQVPQPITQILSVHPNPSMEEFVFDFSLRRPSEVKVLIFDITGRLVRTITKSVMQAGTHQVAWDGILESGRSGPSGVYFYEFTTGDYTSRGKVTKTK